MKTKLLKRLRRKVRKNLRIVKCGTCYKIEQKRVDVFTNIADWVEFPAYHSTFEKAKSDYDELSRSLLSLYLHQAKKVVYK